MLPGATVGVLGSGQLGRMFAISARRMGYRVHTFSPDQDTPTGQVADLEVTASYDDLEAVREFASHVDFNGPGVTTAPKTSHALNGNVDTQAKFLAGAKPRYPVMANYSFDYGNSHWTVLDSNPYMDWNNPELRAWVEKDLAGASNATWRFVAFHHPGFNSSTSHFYDQWMRYLTPVFEKGVVDVVFSGHVHNYQRTFPLTFTPKGETGPRGEVDGAFNFDTQFADGATAKPRGIIYIVSGAGGAGLYNPELQATPEKWQIFTDKYIADQNSFSAIEVDGKKFKFRQIGADGKKLDAFQIIK